MKIESKYINWNNQLVQVKDSYFMEYERGYLRNLGNHNNDHNLYIGIDYPRRVWYIDGLSSKVLLTPNTMKLFWIDNNYLGGLFMDTFAQGWGDPSYGIYSGTDFAKYFWKIFHSLSGQQLDILFDLNSNNQYYIGHFIDSAQDQFLALWNNPTQEQADILYNWLNAQTGTILWYEVPSS